MFYRKQANECTESDQDHQISSCACETNLKSGKTSKRDVNMWLVTRFKCPHSDIHPECATRNLPPPAPGSYGDHCALGHTFLVVFSGASYRPLSSLYLRHLYLSPISLTSLVPWHKSWSKVVRSQTHCFTSNKLSPCCKATETRQRQGLGYLKPGQS